MNKFTTWEAPSVLMMPVREWVTFWATYNSKLVVTCRGILESEALNLVATLPIPTKLDYFFRMNYILSYPPDYEINEGFVKLKWTATNV